MSRAKLWIEVAAGALEHNLQAIRRAANLPAGGGMLAHPVAPLAVIKANAYGHGAALCAPVLARAGAEWLGVTDAVEGAAVRTALLHSGIVPELQPNILVMCGMEPDDAPRIVAHRLTPVVWQAGQIASLAAAAEQHGAGERVPVHLEIDTGMARQGVWSGEDEDVATRQADQPPARDLDHLLATLRDTPQLRLGGVLTHFSSAEIAHASQTTRQQRRFDRALALVQSAGLRPGWIHAGNTATLDEGRLLPWLAEHARRLDARLLARSGLALYGHALPIEHGTATLALHLRRVATWKTRIVALSDVAHGATVGYNATYTAPRRMRIALLPVGYADGLRRELSGSNDPSHTVPSGGWTIVRGRRAPIVGRVSMNLTTVDVTAIPDAALADEVTLLGNGISADDHARLAATIPYEILCAMRGTRELVS